MKSLKILRLLLQDAGLKSSRETERDWLTIQSRFKNEGLSFLMITLPSFTSWLEQSLEARMALPTIFAAFHRKAGRGHVSLPAFLLGLTERIFDAQSGRLLETADPSAVYFIRQICSFFKKTKIACSEERNILAIKKFLETDRALPKRCSLSSVARSVANAVILSLNYSDSVRVEPGFPKHGPGATVEKLWGNQKYIGRDYYARWMRSITIEELYGFQAVEDWYGSISVIKTQDERPCRLSLVPKTLKAPRTIAVEPVAMQFAQQLVSSRLIAAMGKSYLTKHIRFDDQSVNNELAKEGSHGKGRSTIDLSEASDRIAAALVREIVRADSGLRSQLFAVRSSKISIRSRKSAHPGNVLFRKEEVHLRKFSTSGSAVTFPVETLVFFTLALSAIVEKTGPHRDLMAAIRRYSTEVSVFGDDIVVPDSYCDIVCSYLETFGLKVNWNKTFSKGEFRESCGGDYFRGHDVTPKYLRRLLPSTRSEANEIASCVSTANQLHAAGCWNAANYMREMVDSIFRMPLVKRTSPGLGWFTFQNAYEFNPLKRNAFGEYVVRTLVLKSKSLVNSIDGVDALLKALISRGVQEDSDHLLRSVPQYTAVVRTQLVTPY
jgi:hypothetical protein